MLALHSGLSNVSFSQKPDFETWIKTSNFLVSHAVQHEADPPLPCPSSIPVFQAAPVSPTSFLDWLFHVSTLWMHQTLIFAVVYTAKLTDVFLVHIWPGHLTKGDHPVPNLCLSASPPLIMRQSFHYVSQAGYIMKTHGLRKVKVSVLHNCSSFSLSPPF